ncbi:tubulin epsilon chain-like isoform X1 [Hetaerina americana]
MEDGVISQLKKSKIGDIFDDDLKVTHYPGSGNNWAVGHTVHGKKFREALINVIHRAVEKCGCLQGFILLCSLGGGTGSGLGTYILKILEEDFPRVERFVGCVYPDENDDVITSPYNVMMSSKVLTEHATCVFPFDNKALISICDKIRVSSSKNPHVSRHFLSTELLARNKPFQDMNSLIVKMLLDLTSSSRYSGSLNLDMNEIYSNMVPFPKMHYISSGLSPLYDLNYRSSSSCRQDELFSSCWSLDNQLCRYINPLHSTLLAVSLIGRGSIGMGDMRQQVERLQAKAKFAPWALESVKAGLCCVPAPGSAPASLLGLFNSTGIIHLLSDVLAKFSKLYSRKAHLHHYLAEGMEVSEIEDCVLTMQDVIHHYKGVNTMTPDKTMPQLSVY